MIWRVYQPGMDTEIRIPGNPVKIHSEADEIQKASPVLGEDTDEILKDWLDMSQKDIEELRRREVI